MNKIFVAAIFCLVLSVALLFRSAPTGSPDSTADTHTAQHQFAFNDTNFMLDGKVFQIIAGEVHFSRIPQEYWKHRIQMIRSLGCNTLSVYVMWNYHETVPGKFDFTSYNKQLATFINQAQQEGMYVILRPGPYVCAEWDFGGLPYWLLQDDLFRTQLRQNTTAYIQQITPYIQQVAALVAPLQVTQGGNILMIQIENEYGYYGSNNSLPTQIKKIWDDTGLITIPYYTADGPKAFQLKVGEVKGAAIGLNPGVDDESWQTKNALYPHLPGLSSETYTGWFTHWGDKNWGTKSIKDSLNEVQYLLNHNYSFSLYMAHGGTNFGFTAGASGEYNKPTKFQPLVTSYDYDAPINEMGGPTEKFYALRLLIQSYTSSKIPDPPAPNPVITLPAASPEVVVSILDIVKKLHPMQSEQTQFMEQLGLGYGFLMYETNVTCHEFNTITIHDLKDFASIYIDEEFQETLYSAKGANSFKFNCLVPGKTKKIQIFVENLGRYNFGNPMFDRKGITSEVLHNNKAIKNWNIYKITEADILAFVAAQRTEENSLRRSKNGNKIQPGTIFATQYKLESVGDTYLDMSNWTKGYVWVNAKNLGRYWNIGPQYRLYCPGVWLKPGYNDIWIFDFEQTTIKEISGKTTLK